MFDGLVLSWSVSAAGIEGNTAGRTRGTEGFGGFVIECAAAAEPWMNAGWFVLMYAVWMSIRLWV